MQVRKTKKATNTETAFNSFIAEIETRSCNINEMLQICVTNSWSGFKFKWIDNLKINQNGSRSEQSNKEIFDAAIKSDLAKQFKFNPKTN